MSYNTRDMTLACLESVLASGGIDDVEILVLDNASNDGSAEAARNLAERINVYESPENVGFARANNQLSTRARGRRLLLLNSDTVVSKDAINNLLAFADDHPDARMWGGRTTFEDGSLNPGSCWGRPTPWSMTCRALGLNGFFSGVALCDPEGYGGWKRDSVREVDIVSGCFMLIDRDLWDELGGFAPEFFMYGEDADLSLRARAKGARPLITPSAQIVHHGGRSWSARPNKVVRLLESRMRLVDLHWPRHWRWYGRLMHAAWVGRRALGWSVLSVLGGTRARERARLFTEVWSRRSEWFRSPPDAAPVIDS